MSSATSFYDFKALDATENEVSLSDYKGKVVLVVNTASKCGFTPQYKGLEAMYKKLNETHPDNFAIIGFPCNQFGGQEPGSNKEIQDFICNLDDRVVVTFPVMAKIDVKGKTAHPLYQWLRSYRDGFAGHLLRFLGQDVKWNFEKFLIGRDGQIKGRWLSLSTPEKIEPSVLKELEKET